MVKVLEAQVNFSDFVKFDQQLLKLQGTSRKASDALLGIKKAGDSTSRSFNEFAVPLRKMDALLPRTATGLARLKVELNQMTFGFEKGVAATNRTSTAIGLATKSMNPLQKELKESTASAKTYEQAMAGAERQTRATASAARESSIGSLNPNSTQKGPTAFGANSGFLNTIGGRTNRAVLQNTAFQLQDIIVQLEMGVPVTRTLAQQLPQLLGAFGALGAGIGVLVGGALSVLPFLLRDSANDAEDLSKQTIDLSKSYEDLAEAQKMAMLSTGGLKAEFGGASSSLREFLRLQAEQENRNFEADRKSVTNSIEQAPSVAEGVAALREFTSLLEAEKADSAVRAKAVQDLIASGLLVGQFEQPLGTTDRAASQARLENDFAAFTPLSEALVELSKIEEGDFEGLTKAGIRVTQALQSLDAEELGLDPAKIRLMIEKIGEVTRAGFAGIFSATEKAVFSFAQGIDERAEGLGQKYLDALDKVKEREAESVASITKQLNEAEKRLSIETALDLLTEGSSTAGAEVDALRETIFGLKEELIEAKDAAELLGIEKLIPGISKTYEEAMDTVKDKQENSLPVLKDLIEQVEAQIVKTRVLGGSTETLEAALDSLSGKFLTAAQEIAIAAAVAANANAAPKGRSGAIAGPSTGALEEMRAAATAGAAERAARKAFEERKTSVLAAAKRGLEIATNKVDGVQVFDKPTRSGGGGGKTKAELEFERLFKLAEKIKSSYRTVNETILDDITDLEAALKAGLFDPEEIHLYEKALADLNQQLEFGGLSAKFFADTVEGELNSAFSSVIDGSKTVGEALKDMISNILMEIANQQFQKNISSPIATGISDWISGAIGGAIGGGGGIGSIRPQARPSSFSANGNAFDGMRNVIPFAQGGIVNRPTLFPFAKGTGLMGEAGPEAILPLERGPGGKLGVNASGRGGGGNNVTLIVENNGTNTEAEVQQDSNGAIRLILNAVNRDIQEGGKTYRTLRKTFGVGPMTQGRG